MAEPRKKTKNIAESTVPVRGSAPPAPLETETHGMEREPEQPTLGKQIRAHTNRPHKGDVGRPGTNEEVFQGSKNKELK